MSAEPPSRRNLIGSTDKSFIKRQTRVISELFYGDVKSIVKRCFVAFKEHVGNRDLKNVLIADLRKCTDEDSCVESLKQFIAKHKLMVYVVDNDAERQTLPDEPRELLFGSTEFKKNSTLMYALEQIYDSHGKETEKLEECVAIIERDPETLDVIIDEIDYYKTPPTPPIKQDKPNVILSNIRKYVLELSSIKNMSFHLICDPPMTRNSKDRGHSHKILSKSSPSPSPSPSPSSRSRSLSPSSSRRTARGGSYKKRYLKTRRNRIKNKK